MYVNNGKNTFAVYPDTKKGDATCRLANWEKDGFNITREIGNFPFSSYVMLYVEDGRGTVRKKEEITDER